MGGPAAASVGSGIAAPPKRRCADAGGAARVVRPSGDNLRATASNPLMSATEFQVDDFEEGSDQSDGEPEPESHFVSRLNRRAERLPAA